MAKILVETHDTLGGVRFNIERVRLLAIGHELGHLEGFLRVVVGARGGVVIGDFIGLLELLWFLRVLISVKLVMVQNLGYLAHTALCVDALHRHSFNVG